VWQEGPLEIWMKPLSDGSQAVGLFNRGESALAMTLNLKVLGSPRTARLRDLLLHKDLGIVKDSYTVDVAKHGTAILKVSRK